MNIFNNLSLQRRISATAGVTLLEIILVILILSFVYMRLDLQPAMPTQQLLIITNQLADNLRYTQFLSLSRGIRYRWIKTSASTYQIQNSSGTPILLPSGNNSITFPANVSFGALTSLPNSLIAYDTRGAPYTDTASPGTLLASTAVIKLQASGVTTQVSIQSSTGFVTVP